MELSECPVCHAYLGKKNFSRLRYSPWDRVSERMHGFSVLRGTRIGKDPPGALEVKRKTLFSGAARASLQLMQAANGFLPRRCGCCPITHSMAGVEAAPFQSEAVLVEQGLLPLESTEERYWSVSVHIASCKMVLQP